MTLLPHKSRRPLNLTNTHSSEPAKKKSQRILFFKNNLKISINYSDQLVIITPTIVVEDQQHETIRRKCKSIPENSFLCRILLLGCFRQEKTRSYFLLPFVTFKFSIEEKEASTNRRLERRRRKIDSFHFQSHVRKKSRKKGN